MWLLGNMRSSNGLGTVKMGDHVMRVDSLRGPCDGPKPHDSGGIEDLRHEYFEVANALLP